MAKSRYKMVNLNSGDVTLLGSLQAILEARAGLPLKTVQVVRYALERTLEMERGG